MLKFKDYFMITNLMVSTLSIITSNPGPDMDKNKESDIGPIFSKIVTCIYL